MTPEKQPPIGLPEDLKARILAKAREERSLTRGPVEVIVFAMLLAIAVLFVVLFGAEGWIHWSGRPAPFIIGTGIGWAVTAAVATWLGFGRGRSMVGRSRLLLWLTAAGTPALLFGWMLMWNLLYPQTMKACTGRVGFVCMDMMLTLGVLPLFALALWRARLDPVHPGATGAALGAAMGAWAGFTIDLSCECTDPAHILLGHILPVVLLVGAGFWIGRRTRR